MKHIISGYGPGPGGVNKLVEYLESIVDPKKCEIHYPCRSEVSNDLIRKLIENLVYRPLFRWKLRRLKGAEVILLHQQSIGTSTTQWLLENCSVSLYVMDNGFFCVKAYNYVAGEDRECLRCLGGDPSSARELKCTPRPTNLIDNALKLQNVLYQHKSDIKFITLSENNARLVEKHYGGDVSVRTAYFETKELVLQDTSKGHFNSSEHREALQGRCDVVLHASDISEKGFDYFLQLASKLPEFTFFAPTGSLPSDYQNLSNVSYAPIRWESGLEKKVRNARLVLTPSLWSNTPEAATLKSLMYNGAVGIVKNEYGFANEVDEEAYVALTGVPETDAKVVAEFLNQSDSDAYKSNAVKYVEKYFDRARQDMANLVS